MAYKRLKTASILILLIGLSACASKSINLVKTGDITVKVFDSGNVNITNVYVKKLEHEVYIHADAKPIKRVRFFHPGHLSFELYTADGHQYFNLDVTRYSRTHNDGGLSKMKHVTFWIRMPLNIPRGSVLKVSHHESSVHQDKLK